MPAWYAYSLPSPLLPTPSQIPPSPSPSLSPPYHVSFSLSPPSLPAYSPTFAPFPLPTTLIEHLLVDGTGCLVGWSGGELWVGSGTHFTCCGMVDSGACLFYFMYM